MANLFDAPFQAPSSYDVNRMALPLMNFLSDLPSTYRQGQLDQQRVAEGQRKQQLENLFAGGLPMDPSLPGQVDWSAVQQRVARLSPQDAINLGPRVERQQFNRQIMQDTPGGAPTYAPGASAAPAGDPQNVGYFDRFVGGVAQAESGGERNPYGSVISTGTGHRVYGKYQIYDDNIGPWTQEALGRRLTPQQFLADPNAQEQVARAKLGEYVQKYGYAGAARAWLAGEGGMNNPQARDKFGSTPHGYASKVLGYASRGGPDTQTAAAAAAPRTQLDAEARAAPRASGASQLDPQGNEIVVRSGGVRVAGPPAAAATAQPELTASGLQQYAAGRSPTGYIGQEFSQLPPSAGQITPPATGPTTPPQPQAQPQATPLVPPMTAKEKHYRQLAAIAPTAQEGRYYHDLAEQEHAENTPVYAGGRFYDQRTGQQIGGGGGAGSALTPATLHGAAEYWLQTGKFATGSGRNTAERDAIVNEAYRLADERGIDTADLPNIHQEYRTHQAGLQRFTSGKQGDTVRSFNVLVDHMTVLDQATRALKNRDVNAFNAVRQTIARQFGGTAPVDFAAVKNLVGDEIVKAVVGSAGALADREEVKRDISEARSEAQLLSIIDKYRKLALGQLRGLRQEYRAATGREDFDEKLLLPTTRQFFGGEQTSAPATGGGEWKTLPGSGVRYREVR